MDEGRAKLVVNPCNPCKCLRYISADCHTWLGFGCLVDLLLVAVRVCEGAEEVVDSSLKQRLGLSVHRKVRWKLRRLDIGQDGSCLCKGPVRRCWGCCQQHCGQQNAKNLRGSSTVSPDEHGHHNRPGQLPAIPPGWAHGQGLRLVSCNLVYIEMHLALSKGLCSAKAFQRFRLECCHANVWPKMLVTRSVKSVVRLFRSYAQGQ